MTPPGARRDRLASDPSTLRQPLPYDSMDRQLRSGLEPASWGAAQGEPGQDPKEAVRIRAPPGQDALIEAAALRSVAEALRVTSPKPRPASWSGFRVVGAWPPPAETSWARLWHAARLSMDCGLRLARFSQGV